MEPLIKRQKIEENQLKPTNINLHQQSLNIKEIMDKFQITPKLLTYINEFKFPYVQDVDAYEKLLKIGQGTFG